MDLAKNLILEDWEDYLHTLPEIEATAGVPFELYVDVKEFVSYNLAEQFTRANPPRPYANSNSDTEQYATDTERAQWVINGMNGRLKKQLENLVRDAYLATGQLPLVGDEYTVDGHEDSTYDKEWGGWFQVVNRWTMRPNTDRAKIKVIIVFVEQDD